MRFERTKRTGLRDYFLSHPDPTAIIVCEEKKFIYMKAAKTAGSSILRAFLEPRLPGKIIHQKDHPEKFSNWLESISDEKLEEYFIFAVVRNPWDRVVSNASYFKIPFQDFIDNFDEHMKDERILNHARPIHPYTHFNGKCFVDMICRFEALQPDFNLVCDQIGLERVLMPAKNVSKHNHYGSYYEAKGVEFVAQRYAKDIEYYGYLFEPSHARSRAENEKTTTSTRRLAKKILTKLGLRK